MRIGDDRKASEIGKTGHETYRWVACPNCDYRRWVILCKGRKPKSLFCVKCATTNFNKTRQAEKCRFWKGGRRISNGYVILYLPDNHKFASMRVQKKYIAEHRLVMANHLGRPLKRHEIVHHKDGNRSNNDLYNLELTSLGEHSKAHGKGYSHGFKQGYADGMAAAKGATK